MKNPARTVISLFVLCYVVLIAAFSAVTYLSATTTNDPTFLEGLSQDIWTTIEVFSGAVVGALSAAFAQAFGTKNEGDKNETSE